MSLVINNFLQGLGISAMFAAAVWSLNPAIAVYSGEELPENRLEVIEVYFSDGFFHQRLRPTAGHLIQADWAAIITEGDHIVCSGSGRGTYQPEERSSWNPSDWTGGDCSAMVEGREYRAEASWQHGVSGDQIHTIAVDFDFIYHVGDEG